LWSVFQLRATREGGAIFGPSRGARVLWGLWFWFLIYMHADRPFAPRPNLLAKALAMGRPNQFPSISTHSGSFSPTTKSL